jgi:[acyl-carrier-protein] S-malonyltransferase
MQQSPWLVKPMHARMQWEATLIALVMAGKKQMLELGPGQQIKAMVRRIDPETWKAFQNVAP